LDTKFNYFSLNLCVPFVWNITIIWRFVDTFWIDKEEGILLKATSKNRWVSNGVPDEFTTTKEIVLEKEDW